MKRKIVAAAGLTGFLGVALGAFGAHGLKDYLTPEMLSVYKTGVFYHIIHAVVLLAISLSGRDNLLNAFWAILIGIILFSFSLYFYALTSIRFFALITPFGGISLLIGWLLIIISGMKNKRV